MVAEALLLDRDQGSQHLEPDKTHLFTIRHVPIAPSS